MGAGRDRDGVRGRGRRRPEATYGANATRLAERGPRKERGGAGAEGPAGARRAGGKVIGV